MTYVLILALYAASGVPLVVLAMPDRAACIEARAAADRQRVVWAECVQVVQP